MSMKDVLKGRVGEYLTFSELANLAAGYFSGRVVCGHNGCQSSTCYIAEYCENIQIVCFECKQIVEIIE